MYNEYCSGHLTSPMSNNTLPQADDGGGLSQSVYYYRFDTYNPNRIIMF